MKIAIIVPLFLPRWTGGTEIATLNLARRLSARDHSVHVLTTRAPGLPRHRLEQGFNVWQIAWPHIPVIGNLVFYLGLLFRVRRISPEVVHAQDLGMAVPAWLIRLLFHKPYIVWGRGTDVNDPGWLLKHFSRPLLNRAAAVLALDENMRRKLNSISPAPVTVLPNGVDINAFAGLSRATLRARLGFGPAEQVVTFVGRLEPIKGLEFLIAALALIVSHLPDIRLVIVGDGSQKSELESQVQKAGLENKVSFIGKIPNTQVPEYLVCSDIFVLPSLSEGLPNVILEAMAAGLPVVATAVGGIPDLVQDSRNGFLVEPRNSLQLAQKILDLLDHPDVLRRISETNRRAAQQYSWDSITTDLEDIYRRAIDRPPTRRSNK